jgi:hypothetical protein
VNATNPSAVTVGIFDELQQIRGEFQFWATNNVGPRWKMDLTRVLINPTGPFNPISNEYNAMTINMQHVIDDNGLFGTMTLLPDVSAAAPTNSLLPFITGNLNIGETPAYAQVGEVMNVNVGAWIGAQQFSFQWKANNVVISGATAVSYTPVGGDSGKPLTVAVTGTNSVGSTTVTSTATQNVHA